MKEAGKAASLESLEWLEFQQWRCPHPNAVIKHAFNFGEQRVAGFFVDGYLEVQGYKVAYEYSGCRWHYCPNNCQGRGFDLEQARAESKRKYLIEREVNCFVQVRSCEWMIQRKQYQGEWFSQNFCFVGKTKVTENEILESIQKKSFFGLVRLDVHTPQSVIDTYSQSY